MYKAGMVNIGQLLRKTYGEDDIFPAGFAGYEGTEVLPAKPGSIECCIILIPEGVYTFQSGPDENIQELSVTGQ